jgi:hypothetical protein
MHWLSTQAYTHLPVSSQNIKRTSQRTVSAFSKISRKPLVLKVLEITGT